MAETEDLDEVDIVVDGDVDDADGDVEDYDDEALRLKPKPTPRAARSWRQNVRIGLVAATFLGAFGLAGGLGWQLWQHHERTTAAQTARTTAVDYAQVLTSLDPSQVDQNFAAILNGATGTFKDAFTKASVQLRQPLIDIQSSTQGVVVESAIQPGASRDKVVVLLMVDQRVTGAEQPDPRTDRSRMKLTMEHIDGRWLASDVELP